MEKDKNIILLERFFDGKATRKEVQYLLEQLKDARFEQAWMQKQWDAAAEEMNPAVQKRIFENIKEKTAPKKIYNLKQWLTVAASVLLIITTSLSAYLLYEGNSKKLGGDMKVAVEKGQKANITLPDGSRVWMNSGSTLTYGRRFNQKERIIDLKGEAYFEVAKKKSAPFIVQSNGFSVEALGTAFDVKAYPEEKLISAVLIRGKVEVGDDLNKIRLMPNQKVVYDRISKSMQKSDVDDGSIYADWRHNQLTFESESFEDITVMLERNYNIRFVFQSDLLKTYRFTGTIGNTSLESLLQIFAMTSPFTYSIKDSVIYLKENKETMPYYKRMTGQ